MAGTTSEPRIEVLPDAVAVGRRAAEIFAAQIGRASRGTGCVCVAFSRPTPQESFRSIDAVRLGRTDVHLFQVDERRAHKGSDDRNLTLIERDLPTWVRNCQVHPMPVDGWLFSVGARRYAKSLASVCDRPPVLDIVHLGLGPDGHTASLLPGDPVLDVTDRSVATTREHNGFRRMTLTYPVLDAARLVVFVVTGAAKAEALARVVRGDPSMPAARVAAHDRLFIVDEEAASLLG